MKSSNQPNKAFSGPELCAKEAHEIVNLLKKGEISPTELIDASSTRINQIGTATNAIPTRCEDRARAAIHDLGKQSQTHATEPGWLAGLPLGIKDLTPVAGVRTTFGSKGYTDHIPEKSAPVIERIEERGGLVVGKTNTPEFGAGANTFNEVFGRTPNAWNKSLNAGGSSGGSAVALATGQLWLAHGTDLAGSLRTPAAYNGVVGLRPTPGRVPGRGTDLLLNTESVEGPMARSVMDCALFLDTLSGYSTATPQTLDAPSTSFQEAVRRATPDIRIGFSMTLGGFAPVEKEMERALLAAMAQIEGAGIKVDEDEPHLPNLFDIYLTLRAMVWAGLLSPRPEEIKRHFKATLADNIDLGERLTVEKVYEAQRGRAAIYDIMAEYLGRYDVLACPVVGLMPGPLEEEYPTKIDGKPVENYVDWLRFAFLATTASLPAISIPVGLSPQGIPVGLQLIGPARGEAKVLQAAKVIEDALGGRFKTPIDPA